MQGLAFDPGTSTLYGTDVTSDQLITIDVATGNGTAVGALGFDKVLGLAFDPASNTLYGTDEKTFKLITIDTWTGAGTSVGPLGPHKVSGVGFDSGTNTLVGADALRLQLLDIDTALGSAIAIGYFAPPDTGSAYVFGISKGGIYCTAGTSAAGCRAGLSAVGTASATAPSGFLLTATTVEGAQAGIFFYGTNGRQAHAWGKGTSYKCVVPPVRRGGPMSGVGSTGTCDGSFTQDLNARWQSHPPHNPGAGALVQAQLWYLDPGNTSGKATSLSNAIEFQVGP